MIWFPAVLVINGVSIWAILVMNIIWFCNLEPGVSFLKKLLFKAINRAEKYQILSNRVRVMRCGSHSPTQFFWKYTPRMKYMNASVEQFILKNCSQL